MQGGSSKGVRSVDKIDILHVKNHNMTERCNINCVVVTAQCLYVSTLVFMYLSSIMKYMQGYTITLIPSALRRIREQQYDRRPGDVFCITNTVEFLGSQSFNFVKETLHLRSRMLQNYVGCLLEQL